MYSCSMCSWGSLTGSAGEGDLWVKTLGPPGQFLLLCPEDLLLQPIVESPQQLASCQHTVTNSLHGGRGEDTECRVCTCDVSRRL